MLAQFIYTETNAPGPYRKETGFKFKCVNIPDFASAGGLLENQLQALKPILERGAAEFVSYKPVEVDPFMPDEKFAALAKDYVYRQISQTAYVFGQLFTSGENNGRPNNPFHQGLVFEESNLTPLIETLNSTVKNVFPRPADLSYWDGWQYPRGEIEVNAVELSQEFCAPKLSPQELSVQHHSAFDLDPLTAEDVLARYATSLYFDQDLMLPASARPFARHLMSIASHAIPQRLAWRIGFTTLGVPKQDPTFKAHVPTIGVAPTDIPFVAQRIPKTWARAVAYAYQNGFDIDFNQMVDTVGGFFKFNSTHIEIGQRFFGPLSIGLLAFLMVDEDYLQDQSLVHDVLGALLELSMPASIKSREARIGLDNLLASSGPMFTEAELGIKFIDVLHRIPVGA
jgi:hypothetical protein